MNKFKKYFIVFMVACLLVLPFSLTASAFSNDEFPNKSDFPSVNVPISRPQLDGKTVYAEVLTKYGDGTDYRVLIYIFTVTSIVANHFTCTPKITDGNHIDFDFYYKVDDEINNTNDFPVVVTSYYYDSVSGFLKFKGSYSSNWDFDFFRITTTQNYGIYGVHYYGMDFTDNAVPSVQKEFVVNYATEGLIVNYLSHIKSAISDISVYSYNILSLLTNFENYFSLNNNYFLGVLDRMDAIVSQNAELINGHNFPDDGSSLPPSEEAPPRDDSTIDDIKEAEKDALGGKTDEEIQQGVEDALDQEKQKEQINAEDIPTSDIEISHNVFNVVFDFMGPQWNSYFILTLTVAFAAFLIGRRY